MELTMTWALIVVGVATIYAALFLLKILASSNNKNHLPIGPSGLPLIGNFHILLDSKRLIHQILSSLSKSYGLVMHGKFGSHPILIISSIELAR